MSYLTNGQREFADEFSKSTGLDPRVVGSWLLAEQSGSAAQNYEGKGYHNWLNIAQTDSGPAKGAYSRAFGSARSAARASAEWMQGRGALAHEYGAPAPGIRSILHSRGQGYDAQIRAIAGSGWASSGYNGGNTLRQLYQQLAGEKGLVARAYAPVARNEAKEEAATGQRFNPYRELAQMGSEAKEGGEGPQYEAAQLNPIQPIGEEQRVAEGEKLPGEIGQAEPAPQEYAGSTEDMIQKNWEAMANHFDENQPLHQPVTGEGSIAPGYQGSTKLGGFLAGNAHLVMGRLDQGQDGSTTPGGPIIAPGNGVVVSVLNDPGGFGFQYPVWKFTSGPLRGREVYGGHTHSVLKVGEQFKTGQTLSLTGYGTSHEGNARTPGWFEIGFWPPGNMNAGAQIAPYLK